MASSESYHVVHELTSPQRRQSVDAAEGSKATCHGPITQTHFLEALGIRERLESLLQTASQEEGEQLISGYYRLVSSSSEDAESRTEVSTLVSMLPLGLAGLPGLARQYCR